eukprot:c1406_g1_i1.p2 GENE.c1406_g1_i1~~c1406_g1_i1.p2  ORF type:complete len:171 (+),score=22.35 c1406_g1_i1:52-513(+)
MAAMLLRRSLTLAAMSPVSRLLSTVTPAAASAAGSVPPTLGPIDPSALNITSPSGIPLVVDTSQNPAKLTTGTIGQVIRTAAETKMNKTTVVMVVTKKVHLKTGKGRKWTKKYLCHDEHNICKVDDLVRIKLGRPMSRRKSWYIDEIVKRRLE